MDNRTGLQMTTEQYCRINRYALNMLMAIQIIMGLMSIIHMVTTGFSWKDLVLILVMAGAVIADFAGYMLMKESKTTMIFYSIVWMIAYSMAVFLGPVNPIMCLFPVLVVMMLYLDPVAVAASILYSLLVHIIKLIVEAASGRITGENVSSYILDCIGLVAICIGAFFVTKLLLKYIRESQAQVTEQAAQQMEISASVQETAEVIGRHFGEITNQLEEIVGQLESNNLAITNIAESTEATAEAVQEQAVMTRDISECIDTTAQNANDIIDTTDQLYDVVGEGIEAVEGLQEQTEMVNEQTNETSEALRKLADNVDEVNSITQTIRDISSQTNLLALNASIEAARAGDAGRGFAVVADEIRNLADQTKKSTEQITIIINDLTAVTRESMSKLQVTVDSVHVQTEMVEKVNVTFMETCKSIDELKDYTGSISDNVDTVIDANKHIIDSISQLSAGTEEVSSASQEGMAVSNVILEQMQDFASSVEEMSELVEQLAGSVSGSDFETIPVYEGIEEPEVYEDAKDSETYEDAEEPEAYRDEAEAAVYDEDAEEPEAYEDEAETAVYDEDAEEPEAYEDEAETAVYDEDAEEPEVYEDEAEAVSYDENVEESEAYEDVEDSETYEDTETEW